MDIHEVRITSGGKIRTWVEFALNHFTAKPDEPLMFHTIPAPSKTSDVIANETSHNGGKASPRRSEKGKERLPSSVTNVPRLISVVEIIKREYLKTLDATHHDHGQLTGLYQYNQIGDLPDAELGENAAIQPEEARIDALTAALQGKNHPRLKTRPYMKVILSRKAIHGEPIHGFTSQKPALRRLPRSTTARAKRRLKKQTEQNVGVVMNEDPDPGTDT